MCNFSIISKPTFGRWFVFIYFHHCVNMNMYSEGKKKKRWKEHINISHGIRNTMQIDCLTGIKLLASN